MVVGVNPSKYRIRNCHKMIRTRFSPALRLFWTDQRLRCMLLVQERETIVFSKNVKARKGSVCLPQNGVLSRKKRSSTQQHIPGARTIQLSLQACGKTARSRWTRGAQRQSLTTSLHLAPFLRTLAHLQPNLGTQLTVLAESTVIRLVMVSALRGRYADGQNARGLGHCIDMRS